jgi:Anaphase-promoting complex subunit 5
MPAEGLRHFELGAKLASGAVWLSFGTRPDVHGKAFAAHAHWLLGHQDEALAACREAITLARAIDHPYSQALALAYASITHQMRRDLPELRNMVDELRRLCDRYDFVTGRVHHDRWWLPEVMRMRAAYDDEQAAIARLLSAAQMASEHGSVVLLRRCERDLGRRNVRLPAPGVRPTA